MRTLRIAALALVALVGLSACAGKTARKEVLLPALQLAWTGVSADVARGIDAAESAGDIDSVTALQLRASAAAFHESLKTLEGAIEAITVWETQLAPMAIRGIQALILSGQLAPPLDEILLARVDAFGRALRKLEDA
jgi:hypothetical protein